MIFAAQEDFLLSPRDEPVGLGQGLFEIIASGGTQDNLVFATLPSGGLVSPQDSRAEAVRVGVVAVVVVVFCLPNIYDFPSCTLTTLMVGRKQSDVHRTALTSE